MSAKMRIIIMLGLFILSCFTIAYASGTIPIQDAFSQGNIQLVFEGAGDDGKTLKILIVNTGSESIRIAVQKGETSFNLNSRAIKTIIFALPSESVLEVAPQKSAVFSAQQTGSQRIYLGNLTATKTAGGIKFEYNDLAVGDTN